MDLVARSDTAATHRHDAADGGSNPPVTVSAAVIDQLGVRTAPVRRGELKRHIQGFGVFVRNSSQAYRPTNQGFEAGPGDSGQAPTTALLQGQIFEREAPLLRVGQRVRVRPFYLSSKEWTGKVLGFETQVNQSTRTQVFHVAVDTGAASVPSGMTANLSIELDPIANVLLVPREAVIRTGQGARVVVALGEGRFKPRPVQADDLGEDEIVIRSGLNEGEQVVVSAQFLLDSEANLEAGLRRLDSTPREHNPAAEAGQ
jgi:multidrug efflux pump subunit AcrA (membrane-fusion protein)